MDKRKFSRMLRQSNVEDLLDDGIENGSDLKAKPFAQDPLVADADDTPDVSNVDTPTQSTPLRDLPEQQTRNAMLPKGPISHLGLLLGSCFLLAGVVLLLYPRDVHVYHDRIKHLPYFVEHVTASGSQAYAVIAMIVGIALCGLSLYRPKE